jgi:lysyl-tRNA synthetase, class II
MTYSKDLCTTLDSSLLKAAAYASDETLELEFRTGAVYRYFSVPCTVFENLITATSKGAYFNRTIRNSFRHQRVA